MTTEPLQQNIKQTNQRRIITGIFLLVIGLIMFILFARNTQPGQLATFGMNLNTNTIQIPDLVLPVQPSLYALIAVTVFLAGWQLARGIRSNGLIVGVIAFSFVAAFLIWATKEHSFNLVGMLSSSLVRATPIALAALCGVISERAAVVNIAIEGIMLLSAQSGVVAGTLSHNLWVGLVVAILTGGLIAGIHAILVIRFKVDQIVSGVAINIFGTGTTSFISSRFLEKNIDGLNNSGTFQIIPIPLLSKIPIIWPVFFQNNIIVYLMILMVVVIHILLFYTPWGLRTRAVG